MGIAGLPPTTRNTAPASQLNTTSSAPVGLEAQPLPPTVANAKAKKLADGTVQITIYADDAGIRKALGGAYKTAKGDERPGVWLTSGQASPAWVNVHAYPNAKDKAELDYYSDASRHFKSEYRGKTGHGWDVHFLQFRPNWPENFDLQNQAYLELKLADKTVNVPIQLTMQK